MLDIGWKGKVTGGSANNGNVSCGWRELPHLNTKTMEAVTFVVRDRQSVHHITTITCTFNLISMFVCLPPNKTISM